jgi:hypothetical protein
VAGLLAPVPLEAPAPPLAPVAWSKVCAAAGFTTPVKPWVRKAKSFGVTGTPGVSQLKKLSGDFGTVASPLVSTS